MRCGAQGVDERFGGWARWLAIVGAFAFALTFASTARAGELSGGTGRCPLTRSPWVPHLATPAAIECTLDEDLDGVDDELEATLAECYVPLMRYVEGEPARLTQDARFPGSEEPFTTFNVWPVASNRIRVRYITLYASDGGFFQTFIGGAGGPGIDSHPGDSQSIEVELSLGQTADGMWFTDLEVVDVSAQRWSRSVTGTDSTAISCRNTNYVVYMFFDCGPPPQVQTLELAGDTHPTVIASWGKHHTYLNPPRGTWKWKYGEVRDPIGGIFLQRRCLRTRSRRRSLEPPGEHESGQYVRRHADSSLPLPDQR